MGGIFFTAAVEYQYAANTSALFFKDWTRAPRRQKGSLFHKACNGIKNLFVYNINQAEEKIRKVEHIQKSRGGGSSSSGRRIVAALEKHIIRVRGKSETSLSLAC